MKITPPTSAGCSDFLILQDDSEQWIVCIGRLTSHKCLCESFEEALELAGARAEIRGRSVFVSHDQGETWALLQDRTDDDYIEDCG